MPTQDKEIDNLLLEFDEYVLELENSDDDIFIKYENENINEDDEANEESSNDKQDESKEESTDSDSGDDDFGDDDFGDEEDLSLEDIGKVYQLNMLYDTLLQLNDNVYDLILYDPKLKKVLILIKKLIDYYKLIIYNLNKYLDNIDNIIKLYRGISNSLISYLEIKTRKIIKKRMIEEENK